MQLIKFFDCNAIIFECDYSFACCFTDFHNTGKLYICRDFEVSVQTLSGGDLERTVTALSGFDLSAVTVMEREAGELDRYDLTWSCAGELGPEVGRAAILSDGSYHYCLTVMTPEEHALEYQEIFNGMFESFTVS